MTKAGDEFYKYDYQLNIWKPTHGNLVLACTNLLKGWSRMAGLTPTIIRENCEYFFSFLKQRELLGVCALPGTIKTRSYIGKYSVDLAKPSQTRADQFSLTRLTFVKREARTWMTYERCILIYVNFFYKYIIYINYSNTLNSK